jgi:hypothetical protein
MEIKNRHILLGIAAFSVIVYYSGFLDDSPANPCDCEKEMYTWATGGNTFNTTLKVDCLEKYYGKDNLNVYSKMNGSNFNSAFLTAWDKAKKECES